MKQRNGWFMQLGLFFYDIAIQICSLIDRFNLVRTVGHNPSPRYGQSFPFAVIPIQYNSDKVINDNHLNIYLHYANYI